jgi:hypothetical protein
VVRVNVCKINAKVRDQAEELFLVICQVFLLSLSLSLSLGLSLSLSLSQLYDQSHQMKEDPFLLTVELRRSL